jgi:Ca2+-binding EF-hand superfamily protein
MVFLIGMATFLYATNDRNQTVDSFIAKYDRNSDGMIFYTEAPQELQDDFCQYDVNQDGFIDRKEALAIE